MKPYVAKSLAGAQRKVRELQRQIDQRDSLIHQWSMERIQLAKLAAGTPQFYNPLFAMEAKQIRDRILKHA